MTTAINAGYQQQSHCQEYKPPRNTHESPAKTDSGIGGAPLPGVQAVLPIQWPPKNSLVNWRAFSKARHSASSEISPNSQWVADTPTGLRTEEKWAKKWRNVLQAQNTRHQVEGDGFWANRTLKHCCTNNLRGPAEGARATSQLEKAELSNQFKPPIWWKHRCRSNGLATS